MKIDLNEIKGMVYESVSRILIESQESDSQKMAMRLLMTQCNMSKEDANHFVRITLREALPSLRDKQIGKFTLGATRMYINDEFRDDKVKDKFNITLRILINHYDKYDKNLNGLSAKSIIATHEDEIFSIIEKEKSELGQKDFNNSEYEIKFIPSFEDASRYSHYTSWCITHSEHAWEKYTKNGYNNVYFCLKRGFEKTNEEIGPDCPLDEYGLSMISVIINPDGQLVHCTCRWNHDNHGNDYVMGAKELSEVLHVNFYETFKYVDVFSEKISQKLEMIKNGTPIYKVFPTYWRWKGKSNIYVIYDNDLFNIIDNEGKIYLDKWYDSINSEIGIVRQGKYYNIILDNFDFAFKVWVDDIGKVYGVPPTSKIKMRVEYQGKYNYIDENGRLLLKYWYDGLGLEFEHGWTFVKDDRGLYNMIGIDCQYLSKQWFFRLDSFSNSRARLCVNDVAIVNNEQNEYNFINTNGEILFDKWFNGVNGGANGKIILQDSNGWALYDIKTREKSTDYYERIENLDGKLFKVYAWIKNRENGKFVMAQNLMFIDGKRIFKNWFFDIATHYIAYDVFVLKGLKGENLGTSNGDILLDEWVDKIKFRQTGFELKKDGLENFYSLREKRVFYECWYEQIDPMVYNGTQLFTVNNKYNFFNYNNGSVLFNTWFDETYALYNGTARARIGDTHYRLYSNGNIEKL